MYSQIMNVDRTTPGSLLGVGSGSLNIRTVRPTDIYSLAYTLYTGVSCNVNITVGGVLCMSKNMAGTAAQQTFEGVLEFRPAAAGGIIDVVTDTTARIIMSEVRLTKVFQKI